MGKPIQQGKKPPYFRECPICHREFGSRSLEIHMSRCLDRHKSSSDPESDLNDNSKANSPMKKAKSPLKINGVAHLKQASNKPGKRPSKPLTSDDDDEVETSLSDELNHSWPSKAIMSKHHKLKGRNARVSSNIHRSVTRSRKRERVKKGRSVEEANTSSGDEGPGLDSRPKTATLKRPHILDESLKDKVDMTLTKKEFLAAVKLCTDAAVQRGHPNMRIKKGHQVIKAAKAAKPSASVPSPPSSLMSNKGHLNNNNNGSSSVTSSPYMTKIIGKIKKKVIPDSVNKAPEIRPTTTKLERPTNSSLDLPQINVKPQVVISKSLSR